uniref:Butyrophilin subfamily 1 member A1-like n=1 Tax=Chelonoidis abingdonii TaxID=106734 RepID=A0A8C0IVB8_CHEAB|nr:butyrophilin subfamily 1 member A1-like isoform X2 [Chelonoidis abingdonii]
MKMRISFHSHCAKGNLSLSSYLIFFFTVHVSTLESVNFKVIGPDHPIIVSAGEDALLPCHLSPSMSAQEMEVRWFQSKFSELVHLYQHGKDQAEKQISKYQGRTELLKDGIVDGRVVLRICNITPSDGGQFICFFRSSSFYGEATLELKVAGLGSAPRISIDSYQSGGIHMVCESAGWYPEPQVQWRDLKGQHLPSLTEKISQHDNGLFEAQISIIVTETSSQDLSCSVRNSQFNQGKESVVYIADPFFLRAYPWKVAVYILLVVVCLVTCTASYFFWKQHEAKAAHVAERGKLVADLEEHISEKERLQDELRLRRAQIYEVDMTFDSDTANVLLILSEDKKSARVGDQRQNLASNPQRFDTCTCVLGSAIFTHGQHYWEVEVGDKIGWTLGVCKESVGRRGIFTPSPETGFWTMWLRNGNEYAALTSLMTPLLVSIRPTRVGIFLDYEIGTVSFYNVTDKSHLFTFTDTFTEALRPYFYTGVRDGGRNDAPLVICPVRD